jgi:sRNA-binding protein
MARLQKARKEQERQKYESRSKATRNRGAQRMNVPTSGSSAKIDQVSSRSKEIKLLVELNQLEGGTRSVAVLLGHIIIRATPLRINHVRYLKWDFNMR